MRLIDVDVLFEELNSKQISWNRRINDIIMAQPTAYDVEKVDEQIVEYFKTQIENVDDWKVVDFSHDIRKIVRNSGKE